MTNPPKSSDRPVYLLDTDHMTLLERGGEASDALKARLRSLPPDDVASTIISYEEQTRGWLARIAQFSEPDRQIVLYAQLKRQLQNYCRVAVVDFDERAAEELGRLRRAKVRIGTMDLKIAAIALANDATVLTRNASDFSRVPGLRIEDWSQ